MSRAVEINGLTLVPIKEALGVVSYSKDYIARLAREGKIIGSQINRQWFVDLNSLKEFSAEALDQESVRKQKLSNDRKRELMAKECLSALDEVVLQKAKGQRFDAMVVTCGVMLVGLVSGVGLYTATTFSGSKLASLANYLEHGWQMPIKAEIASVSSVDNQHSVFRVLDKPKDTLLLTTITERPVFATEAEIKKITNLGEGILLLPRSVREDVFNKSSANLGEGVNTKHDLVNLFSDTSKVVVTYDENNQGVVSYKNEKGELVEYPFVAVPSLADREKENLLDVVDSTSAPTSKESKPSAFKLMDQ